MTVGLNKLYVLAEKEKHPSSPLVVKVINNPFSWV